MMLSPRLRRALARLLATVVMAGSSAGCERPAACPSVPSTPASALATAAPSAVAPAGALPLPAVKAADTAVVIGERQTFHSTLLGEDRTLLVHTPASYTQGHEVYPVLYLLDGEDHFDHTTAITTFLSAAQRAPEMIVVGVVNPGDVRERDLTPTAVKDRPGSGGAARFLSFLKDEVRPRIEGAYRTAPYRVLVGHSLGGLFALHTLTTAPGTFDAYVVMSPSLWWDDRRLLQGADRALAIQPGLQAFLYLTTGNEGGKMLTDLQAFTATLKARAPKGLAWDFKHLEHESHASIAHRSTYDALEKLFTGWEAPPAIDNVKALQAHYAALSKAFHFEVKLTEQRINGFAFGIHEKSHAAALAAFQLAVELHPDSPTAYGTLGQAYGEDGKLDLARSNFEIAVRKATATGDPALPELKAMLDRANQPRAR
jgi:hypothetical protein